MKKIYSKSATFNSQYEIIVALFHDYRHVNKRMIRTMNKLGYSVRYNGNHYMCYFDKDVVTCISATPSDYKAGRNVINAFKRYWNAKKDDFRF